MTRNRWVRVSVQPKGGGLDDQGWPTPEFVHASYETLESFTPMSSAEAAAFGGTTHGAMWRGVVRLPTTLKDGDTFATMRTDGSGGETPDRVFTVEKINPRGLIKAELIAREAGAVQPVDQ